LGSRYRSRHECSGASAYDPYGTLSSRGCKCQVGFSRGSLDMLHPELRRQQPSNDPANASKTDLDASAFFERFEIDRWSGIARELEPLRASPCSTRLGISVASSAPARSSDTVTELAERRRLVRVADEFSLALGRHRCVYRCHDHCSVRVIVNSGRSVQRRQPSRHRWVLPADIAGLTRPGVASSRHARLFSGWWTGNQCCTTLEGEAWVLWTITAAAVSGATRVRPIGRCPSGAADRSPKESE
jgi:hypothetical protein